MKKAVTFVLAIALLAGLQLGTAAAGETAYRFDPITQKSRALTFPRTWAGYKVFTESCKGCHFTGNGKGASFLHTESKNIRGWKRVFLTRYPECAQNGVWDKLSQENLLVLNDYLHVKARDTYDPYDAKSCG